MAKTYDQLWAEAKNITNQLDDKNNIMAPDWRRFLEDQRKHVWKQIAVLNEDHAAELHRCHPELNP